MPRKVERWSKVPKVAAPGWYRESVTAMGIGSLLMIASEGEPIPVTADWRTDLCRLLMLRPEDRRHSAQAMDRLVEKGLLIVENGYATVRWSAASEKPVRTEREPSEKPVSTPRDPSEKPVSGAKPLEIIKDTRPRQTDRQTDRAAQHARANGFDHSADQKLVLRCWHEVTSETGQPRADRLEQVTAACARQAAAEKLTLEAVARRAFAKFMADAYAAAAKNRFALLASQVDGWVAPPPVEKPALKSEAHREWVPPAWAREEPPVIERPASEPVQLLAAKPPAKVAVSPVLTRAELEAQIAKYEEHLPKLAGIAAEQIRTKIALLRAQLKAAS